MVSGYKEKTQPKVNASYKTQRWVNNEHCGGIAKKMPEKCELVYSLSQGVGSIEWYCSHIILWQFVQNVVLLIFQIVHL